MTKTTHSQRDPKGSTPQRVVCPARADGTHHTVAKLRFLNTLSRHAERPMLVCSFLWFIVIITELVHGMNTVLLILGTVLWALFILYFALRLAIGPNRWSVLKRNWLFVLAILVPVLRFFPFLQSLPLARVLTATFGMQVVWIFASADQGLRSVRRAMGRRGAGYALTITVVVILAGAAGMLHFETQAPDPQGIHSYPKALWWVAMQITNIGSGYRPVTVGGQVLCLAISIFAAAMFGYLTAVLATFFIGRDAEDPKSEIPNQTSIHELSGEVAQLRTAIEEVLRRVPASAPRVGEPAQLTEKPHQGEHGNGSGAKPPRYVGTP